LPDAKRPKAVLFDVDGTLVDSNDAHARSWCDLLEEYGYPTELGRIRRMIGMGGDKIIATVTDLDANSARAKELLAARTARFFKEYFPSVRAIPGGRELFERLRADGLRVAIATSAKPEELTPLLQRAEVNDLVDEQASSGDAKESKPDPDIVHAALGRLGLAAGETVMVGDTPFDEESCRRAGVPFIAVRSGGWSDPDFPGARAIFKDVQAILAAYPFSFAVSRLQTPG
jgi:HAD superfamily hydrolase (TIGR01549 family)